MSEKDLKAKKTTKIIARTIFYLFIVFIAMVILLPIYFLLSISFMSDQEAYDWPIPLGLSFFSEFKIETVSQTNDYLISVYSKSQEKYVSLIQGSKIDEMSEFLNKKTNCKVTEEKLTQAIQDVHVLYEQNAEEIDRISGEINRLEKQILTINQNIIKTKRSLSIVEGRESMEDMEKKLQIDLEKYESEKEQLELQIEIMNTALTPLNSTTFSVFKNLFANYITFFKVTRDSIPALMRSIQVALLTVLIALTIGGMSGYAFARFAFKGKNILKLSTLFVRMFPGIAIAMPMVIILAEMGFYDKPIGLSLVYSVGQIALTIWITASIFMGIPVELEEAAQVFGRTRIGAFIHITLPLALPGLAASAMYAFIGSWAETAQAIVLTQFNPTFPVVVYQTMVGAKGMVNLIAAGGVTMALPAVLFTILIRKYILQMWGGVKV
ncbi:MAG TPA: ABC transporter permease subunit [Thermotogota bacterium]|nr:ABC transporter permease subunit [Thermotogota bacterium]HRW35604.1 ABC transporter permease subunit [Thermotogota bacterium]